MEPLKSRIACLDGMRGIAALIVFFSHAIFLFAPRVSGFLEERSTLRTSSILARGVRHYPIAWSFNGYFAVSFFFVLSGFALTNQVRNLGEKASLGDLLLQRYLRLFPLTFIASLISFCLFRQMLNGLTELGYFNGTTVGDFFDLTFVENFNVKAFILQVVYSIWHCEVGPRLFVTVHGCDGG